MGGGEDACKKRLQIWYLEHGNWIVILARLFYLVLPLHVAISWRIKTEEYFQVQVCKFYKTILHYERFLRNDGHNSEKIDIFFIFMVFQHVFISFE